MPLRRFRRQYEQMLQFGRGRIIGMMEVGWTARRIARQLGRSDCVVRKRWDQWIREMSFTRNPGSGRPRLTSRQEDHHIVRNARVRPTSSSDALQAQVAPSLGAPVSPQTETELQRNGTRSSLATRESRFNPSSDDNCVRAWRPLGERLNPAFALQRHTTPTAGVMWYVHDILQPHVLPLLQWLQESFFNDNARPHTARVLQDCLRTVTPLPWPTRSPDLSPIEYICDHLGLRVGNPTSLDELEARLQQIWNEMSQDIIQNLYASIPDRTASRQREFIRLRSPPPSRDMASTREPNPVEKRGVG
ncbi:transposable element Tcb2 transposase [Trichonephila clavipes]|nr:transposable element Tcb2 transposase [Trichonephila clavipes]